MLACLAVSCLPWESRTDVYELEENEDVRAKIRQIENTHKTPKTEDALEAGSK